jgi:photosystem II stability/assembly factor-like uncharacterized protein
MKKNCKRFEMKICINFILFFIISLLDLYSQYNFDELVFDPHRMRYNDVAVFSENASIAVGQYGYIQLISNSGKTSDFVMMKEKKDLYSVVYITQYNLVTVGDEGLIYFSDNGGHNWYKANSPTQNKLLSVIFINNKTGFASGTNGTIIKTTDGGENWSLINSNVNVDLLEISASTSNILFAVGSKATIIRSLDLGENWTKLPLQSTENINHVKAIGSTKVYFMGDSARVYISNDSGNNLKQSILESKNEQQFIRPKITTYYFKDENNGVLKVFYPLYGENYDYSTTNGGLSWVGANVETSLFGPPTPFESLCMDFANNNFGLLFDSKSYMYKLSYSSKYVQNIEFGIKDFIFIQLAHNNNQFGVISEISYNYTWNLGMFTFDSTGQNWQQTSKFDTIGTEKYPQLEINSVSIPKKDVILLAMNQTRDTTWKVGSTDYYGKIYEGYTLKSDDFGKSWKIVPIPNHEPALEINMYSENYGLLRIGYKKHYMLTKDGGNSWNYMLFPDTSNIKAIWSIDCFSPNLYLLVTSDYNNIQKVYRIYDEGKSWNNDILLPYNNRFFKYFDENNMFSFGYSKDSKTNKYSSTITKSEDGGNTWKDIYIDSNQEDYYFVNCAYYNKKHFMVFTDKNLYLTHDGGNSWNKVSFSSLNFASNEYFNSAVYVNPNEIILSDKLGRLFKLYIDKLLIVEQNTKFRTPDPNAKNKVFIVYC